MNQKLAALKIDIPERPTLLNCDPGPVDVDFDVQNALKCVAAHKLTGAIKNSVELHRGCFGRIYAYCSIEDVPQCNKKVLKILMLNNKQDVQDIHREVYLFHKLNSTGITPHLYHTFSCGNYFYMVLDRAVSDMHRVMVQQSSDARAQIIALYQKLADHSEDKKRMSLKDATYFADRTVLLSVDQLTRMFQIARDLGQQYGVIHGDLKPDQFLYMHEVMGKADMLVTDFGLAGTLEEGRPRAMAGWDFTVGCKRHRELPPPSVSKAVQEAYVKYFNIFQLALFFFSLDHDAVVLVLDPPRTWRMFPFGKMPFAHPDHPFHIPPDALRQFRLMDCGQVASTVQMSDLYYRYFPNRALPVIQ